MLRRMLAKFLPNKQVIIRHSQPIRWTTENGMYWRQVLESPTGSKALLVLHDAVVSAAYASDLSNDHRMGMLDILGKINSMMAPPQPVTVREEKTDEQKATTIQFEATR